MTGKLKFDVTGYIDALESEFRQKADPQRAIGAKAYMRDQFDFIGFATPLRRSIQKDFFKAAGLPPFEVIPQMVKILWRKPERDFQYFGMELYQKFRKQLTQADVSVFEFMITHKSWWDTVDIIASRLVAPLHLKCPELQEPNCRRWMKSENMWLMRVAIIHQILYKEKTNEKLLYNLILECCDHRDFFIRKAIGWSLRQYAGVNKPSVINFLKRNSGKLSPLSIREASKHL